MTADHCKSLEISMGYANVRHKENIMSASDIIKQLLKAYANSDSELFRKAALQLASNESRIGHGKFAEEIRDIISKFPTAEAAMKAISIAQPRGELAGLIDGSFRNEKLKDVVLDVEIKTQLERIIYENHRRTILHQNGLSATRRILFYGPPGCGKTMSAKALAGELGLPLMTVRFDSLFSKFLGSTANHLKTIFDEMPRRPGVYFFDEFDAVGKNRGDELDVGEVKRVVSSFLQLMDADNSPSLIIAATNFERSIDPAAVRRFDTALHFGLPTSGQTLALMQKRIGAFCSPELMRNFVRKLKGFSFADVSRVCDDAIRMMILEEKKNISSEELNFGFKKTSQLISLVKPKSQSKSKKR